MFEYTRAVQAAKDAGIYTTTMARAMRKAFLLRKTRETREMMSHVDYLGKVAPSDY